MENYVVTPSSEVTFYKNPCELTNKNQLTFSSVTAQQTYFNSLDKIELEDFTYQRREAIIRVPYSLDLMEQYNYVSYCNEEYNDRIFYAYITGMSYINDSLTAVSIELDVYQTYQFDFEMKDCFVERMHVRDDTFGKWTKGEEFELGDYYIDAQNVYNLNKEGNTSVSAYVCIGIAKNYLNGLSNDPYPNGAIGINKIHSGIRYYLLQGSYDINLFLKYLKARNSNYQDTDIVEMYMVPYQLVKAGYEEDTTLDKITLRIDEINFDVYYFTDYGNFTAGYTVLDEITISDPTSGGFRDISHAIDGGGSYTPYNNKLFTFPYNKICVNNLIGGEYEYRPDKFYWISGTGGAEKVMKFSVIGSICSGCSLKVTPEGYQRYGTLINYECGVDLMKFPCCNWINDSYTNWLTQNAVNMQWKEEKSWIDFGRKTLSAVGNAFSNPMGAVGSVINAGIDVYSTAVETTLANRQAKCLTNGANGSNNASVYYAENIHFTITRKRIDREHAQMIDNYFNMYGYRISDVCTPETNSRANWNYIKTINCNIADLGTDPIPEYYKERIKALFNNGVTLWHKADKFLNYYYVYENVAPIR